MNNRYTKILLSFFSALLVCNISIAEQVTSITIENVGHGGQDAYQPPSLNFNDADTSEASNMQLYGYSGVFAFSPLAEHDAVGDSNYYLNTPLGPEGQSGPVHVGGGVFTGRSRVLTTDIAPIDTSMAMDLDTFTSGFLFSGFPFTVRMGGPTDADISFSAGEPALTITSFPFGGRYGSTDYVLHPQTTDPLIANQAELDLLGSGFIGGPVCQDATPHLPMTVRWVNRIANTDRYNYKIAWTHCITSAEDPSLQFDGRRASWILEGIMTAPDTTPATSTVSPVNGSTDVPTNAMVSVTFNEEMDPTTITTASFTEATTGCASITASADNRTFTCHPVGGVFAASTAHTATLDTSVTDHVADTAVALAADINSAFTTGAGADSIAPTIASNVPGNAADVPIDTSVVITFSDDTLAALDGLGAMNTATLGSISILEAGATPIPGTTTTSDGLTFTFTPFNLLKNNTSYSVTVAAGSGDNQAQDLAGNALVADDVTTFTTGAALELTDPDTGARVSIDGSGGESMVSLTILSKAQAGGTPPDRVEFDEAYISFTINGVSGQVDVTIDFPQPITGKVIYKVINGVYSLLPVGTAPGQYQIVDEDTISMTILDNGPQDSDPTVGVITDPIVAATELGARPTPEGLGGISLIGILFLIISISFSRGRTEHEH